MKIDEAYIRELSTKNNEPDWLLNLRLASWNTYCDACEKTIDLRFSNEKLPTNEERILCDEIEDYKLLGGACLQNNSQNFAATLKQNLVDQGVVILPIIEAAKDARFEEKIHKALKQNEESPAFLFLLATFASGYYTYVPAGTCAEMPIQSSCLFNKPNVDQSSISMVFLDEGAELNYIEHCSAIENGGSNQHFSLLDIFVSKNAKLNFASVKKWSSNVENFSFKNIHILEDGIVDYASSIFGSRTSSLCGLQQLERGAKLSYSSINYSRMSEITAQTKFVLKGENANLHYENRAIADSDSVINNDDSIVIESDNCVSFSQCDALLLGESARIKNQPNIQNKSIVSEITHESSIGKIDEKNLDYLRARGISERKARELIVCGFTSKITQKVPVHLAANIRNLVKTELLK